MDTSFFTRLSLLATGLLLAQLACAADLNPPRRLADDVALQAGGTLAGQVVDRNGQIRSGVSVTLVQQGKTIASSATDQAGNFSFGGLRAGVYQVRTNYGGGIYRVWAPRTAPPAAHESVIINVSGAEPVSVPEQLEVQPKEQIPVPPPSQPVPIIEDMPCDDCCEGGHGGAGFVDTIIYGAVLGGVGYGLFEALDHNSPGS